VLGKVAMPFLVNGLAQVAALASLDAYDEMRERVDGVIAERARLVRALTDLGLTLPPSQANFIWLDVPEEAAALGRYSEQRGVVLRVFAGVGVRITVGTPDENDRVVSLLHAAIVDALPMLDRRTRPRGALLLDAIETAQRNPSVRGVTSRSNP
jgi:histidinol-phosphate aminotransferase